MIKTMIVISLVIMDFVIVPRKSRRLEAVVEGVVEGDVVLAPRIIKTNGVEHLVIITGAILLQTEDFVGEEILAVVATVAALTAEVLTVAAVALQEDAVDLTAAAVVLTVVVALLEDAEALTVAVVALTVEATAEVLNVVAVDSAAALNEAVVAPLEAVVLTVAVAVAGGHNAAPGVLLVAEGNGKLMGPGRE